jgi:hypothetical protein
MHFSLFFETHNLAFMIFEIASVIHLQEKNLPRNTRKAQKFSQQKSIFFIIFYYNCFVYSRLPENLFGGQVVCFAVKIL